MIAILDFQCFLPRILEMILPFCLHRVPPLPPPGVLDFVNSPLPVGAGIVIAVLAGTGDMAGLLIAIGILVTMALRLRIVIAAGIVVITVPLLLRFLRGLLLRLSDPLPGGRIEGELT